MNIYERLIENPLFFKWIYHPSPEIENYWESYMKLNPGEAGRIAGFKKEFERLRYSTGRFSEREKKELALRILSRLDLIDRKQKRRHMYVGLLRYAAIAVLFFAIGGYLVYLNPDERRFAFFAQKFETPVYFDEPVLMLGDQDQIRLKERASELDYSLEHTIKLNGNKLINLSREESAVMNQLIIPYGNRSKIKLSDGTLVWLNAGSRLIYPAAFTGKRREVLLSGEAFFDVHRNPDRPFVVKTNALDIKVLGTRFNVSAYPEDSVIQTVLEQGSVAFHPNGAGWFEKDLQLSPRQMAVYNRNKKETRVYEVNTGYYSSWTNGLLSFENTDLHGILKKMERYYNVSLHFENPSTGTMQINGKLDLNEGLDEAFEYLAKVSGVTFDKINEHAYVIK
ncbi:MAG: FecR domain-containing protein [Prolixibacteraceae bacterium]